MIKKQFIAFLIRWLISSASMWICINLFASFKEGSNVQYSFWMYIAAGLIFSLVNSFVKPLATIFALPAIFLTLGLFTIIVNAAMVGLTIWLIPDVYIDFWGALGSCLIISVINFLVNIAMPDVK